LLVATGTRDHPHGYPYRGLIRGLLYIIRHEYALGVWTLASTGKHDDKQNRQWHLCHTVTVPLFRGLSLHKQSASVSEMYGVTVIDPLFHQPPSGCLFMRWAVQGFDVPDRVRLITTRKGPPATYSTGDGLTRQDRGAGAWYRFPLCVRLTWPWRKVAGYPAKPPWLQACRWSQGVWLSRPGYPVQALRLCDWLVVLFGGVSRHGLSS